MRGAAVVSLTAHHAEVHRDELFCRALGRCREDEGPWRASGWGWFYIWLRVKQYGTLTLRRGWGHCAFHGIFSTATLCGTTVMATNLRREKTRTVFYRVTALHIPLSDVVRGDV